MPNVDYSKTIYVVWSSYGHTFMGTGEYTGADNRDAYVSCLTCGAEFVERNLGDGRAEYVTSSGDQPTECTGRSNLNHGSEAVCEDNMGRPCDVNAETGTCTHVDFPCNCLYCNG